MNTYFIAYDIIKDKHYFKTITRSQVVADNEIEALQSLFCNCPKHARNDIANIKIIKIK